MAKSNNRKILTGCIDLMIAGNSIEQCMEKYPEADESLLKVAELMIKDRPKNPRQEFKSELLNKLLKKMEGQKV